MSMSVDGLISGMDTTALITQLVQAEAGQQTALKSRLGATQLSASAYRTVNTTFAAVRSAAEAALKPETWDLTKATGSTPTVTVSSTSAAPGSLTFSVDQLASAHSLVRQDAAWTTADADFGSTSLTVLAADGVTPRGTLSFAAGASITDVAAAINASSHQLSAAVVQVNGSTFALQVTSKKTGADNAFSLGGGGSFATNTQGRNAVLTVGSDTTYTVSSASNTFGALLPGATITVGKADPGVPVSVTVAADPEGVAAKIQALVDAVNSSLTNIRTYTSNAPGSNAALKGDYAVSSLAGQLLDAVSFAVGDQGSAAQVGFQLTRDGKITFDKAKFVTALSADPALARTMVSGRAAGAGDDGVVGNSDDVPAVTGIAQRLLGVARAASDTATGSLVKLAEGQDSLAKDIKFRIESWDLRLEKRREILTRQFSAMETALSSLKNQSTWLAGQLNSLPTSG